jgi:hypothetical protein
VLAVVVTRVFDQRRRVTTILKVISDRRALFYCIFVGRNLAHVRFLSLPLAPVWAGQVKVVRDALADSWKPPDLPEAAFADLRSVAARPLLACANERDVHRLQYRSLLPGVERVLPAGAITP